MSTTIVLKDKVQIPQRSYNRKTYWIVISTIVVTLLYLYHNSLSTPRHPSSTSITKSTYDWSTREPYYPWDTVIALPSDRPHKLRRIQYEHTIPSRFDVTIQERRRKIIKSAATKSWKNYRKYAWMRDELKPVSGEGKDNFGGWAATAVDALDTLWIMGMKNEFYEAVDAVARIDWAKTDAKSCIMFETTIRHLGGLLSAYGLSKAPQLLEKAIEVGDMLLAGFDTPNGLPPFWLHFEYVKKGELSADVQQASASIASLSLEFTHLAQLTKDDKYYDPVARITDLMYDSQNKTQMPGMWPMYLHPYDADFTSGTIFSIGAESDSTYEYLLKMQLLLAGTEPMYEELYRTAASTIVENLLIRPMTPENLDILFPTVSKWDDGEVTLTATIEHLACFAGGMFAMGGKLYDIPEHIEIGARLTKGCIWAYDAFVTGIMPERAELFPCPTLESCEWDREIWKSSTYEQSTYGLPPKGFVSVDDPSYKLRPEALESVFILYRITGDEEYREAAWRMVENILQATEARYGNSAIVDVRALHPEKEDSQESFWLAETLKYAYLTFSPPSLISLDDYVLNTEAHPFKIPKT